MGLRSAEFGVRSAEWENWEPINRRKLMKHQNLKERTKRFALNVTQGVRSAECGIRSEGTENLSIEGNL
jgi:hypothetical protein